MPKKEKPLKLKQCRICFKRLENKQKQFCSDNCRIQNHQIKKKFEKLEKENPNLELIFWNQTDTKGEKLNWNKIKGIENKPSYKITKKIVTRRKPKSI